MNKMMSKDELAGKAVGLPWFGFERGEKFESIAQMLNRNGMTIYASVLEIEYMAPDKLRSLPIAAGSILEPVAKHVSRECGVEIRTAGELMDAAGMTKDDLHHVACSCRTKTISGEMAALRVRASIMPRKNEHTAR